MAGRLWCLFLFPFTNLTSLRLCLGAGRTSQDQNLKEEYLDFLNKKMTSVVPDSVLWFAYPKGTSKMKTDINRDTIRTTGEEFGITTVTAISINDTWSALRFRPIDRVGK